MRAYFFSSFCLLLGIFGAALLSAADREHERGQTITVNSPTTQHPVQILSDSPTEGLTEPSRETIAAATVPREQSSEDGPSATNIVLVSTPASVEHSTVRGVITAAENPVVWNDPEDAEVDNNSDEPESECTYTVLTEEKGTLQPNYENKDSCHQWLIQYDEGYSVDISLDRLDLDADSHDFLLISTDEKTIMDEENPIFTWKITQKRNYRIPDKGTAFLLFVSHQSPLRDKKPGGFRLKYSRYGNITMPDQTTTVSSIPTPPPNNKESIVVTIGCNDVFAALEEAFKIELAKRANIFCEAEKITLKTEVRDQNVYLSSPTQCLETWPNSETCIHLILAIAVDNTNSKKTYELTKQHLQKMWDEWNGEELNAIKIQKRQAPNYKKHVIIYALICTLFIILFSVCLVFLWQWQLRNGHIKEEEKSHSSVPIEVPPLFDYFDTRLDDPEYLPYYDSMYNLGTETSTDDVKFSYGALPPYNPQSTGSSTFHFGRPSNAGIVNDNFFLEEDEEEYEIMNGPNITETIDNKDKDNSKTQKTNQKNIKFDHIYEDPNSKEEENH